MDFGSILARIWTQFRLIPEPVLGLKTGSLRGPFRAKTQGITLVLELWGRPKGLHFGALFGHIAASISAPFLGPLFWGRPAG